MKEKPKFKIRKPKPTTVTRKRENIPKNREMTGLKPWPKNKLRPTTDWISSSSDDDTEESEACIFCNALHQERRAGEGWIQCSVGVPMLGNTKFAQRLKKKMTLFIVIYKDLQIEKKILEALIRHVVHHKVFINS